jgi:hypothetical protein
MLAPMRRAIPGDACCRCSWGAAVEVHPPVNAPLSTPSKFLLTLSTLARPLSNHLGGVQGGSCHSSSSSSCSNGSRGSGG